MTASTILCATDLTDQGDRASILAALVARALGGRVVLLHATGASPDGGSEVPESIAAGAAAMRGRLSARRERAAATLDRQRQACETTGVECEAILVGGRPAEAIEREATSRRASLVVLGRRADREAGYIGPTTHEVVRHAPCPVLVAPPDGSPPATLADGRWVIGIDFSRQSQAAIAAVQPLVRALGGEIVLAQVAAPTTDEEELPWGRRSPQQVLREEGLRADARSLEALAESSEAPATGVQRLCLERPADELLKLANEVDATMIVVGSHGRTGLGRFFLGSVGDRLLRISRRPVLVVRHTAAEVDTWFTEPEGPVPFLSPNRLIVAVDFSEPSRRALEMARHLSTKLELPVHVVHVHEPATDVRRGVVGRLGGGRRDLEIDPETRRQLEGELGEHVKSVFEADAGAISLHVEVGRPVERIHARARATKADLVLVGTTGRSGIQRALMGSVAEALVRSSPVPVLTVH